MNFSKKVINIFKPIKEELIIYYILLENEINIIGFSKNPLRADNYLCSPISLNMIIRISNMDKYNIITIRDMFNIKSYLCSDNMMLFIKRILKENNINVEIVKIPN